MDPHRRNLIKGLAAVSLLAVGPRAAAQSERNETPDPSTAVEFLGCPFTATSLGNVDAGGPHKRHVFLPFICPYDGYAETLTFYGVWAEGYGAGTGGIIEITLVNSENGYPGNTIGDGHITHSNLRSRFGGRGKWSIKGTFSAPVGPLHRGVLYFAHFENVASDNWDNYIGVDVLNHHLGYAYGSSSFVPGPLLRVFYGSDPGDLRTHPSRIGNCLDVSCSGGKHFSRPYTEVWLPSPSHWNARVTATQWSRQLLIPEQDITVSELIVAAKLISGSGHLIVELRNSSNTVLSNAFLPSSAFRTDTQIFCDPRRLSAPVTLKVGGECFATLRAETGAVFTSYPLRCGAKSGGDYTKTVNGYCEWSTDSGRSWSGGWYGWHSSARLKVADLPVAFR